MKNAFVRAVLVLFSGTAAAQGISYLIAPVLTRLYTADEMGELGLYLRAVGFLGALATLRYEFALPLPKRNAHAFLIYRLSLRLALFILIGVGIVAAMVALLVPFSTNELLFGGYTLLSAFFVVLISLGTYWSVRSGEFKRISTSKVVNSFTANGLRWGFGLLGWGAPGLLLAGLIGYFAGSLNFVRQYVKSKRLFSREFSIKKTRVLALTHRDFPAVNLPHALVDLGRDLLIAALLVVLFSKEVFGFYSHAYAMLRLPVALVGVAVGQVLFNRVSELANQGAAISALIGRSMLSLGLLALPVFVILYFYGAPLFGFVFGEEWTASGVQAEIMAPWLLFNFVVSSVSTVPIVLNRQREFFILSLFGTALQIVGFIALPILFEYYAASFNHTLLWVSLTQVIFSIVVMAYVMYYARRGVKSVAAKKN